MKLNIVKVEGEYEAQKKAAIKEAGKRHELLRVRTHRARHGRLVRVFIFGLKPVK